jgi:hypothetical protein
MLQLKTYFFSFDQNCILLIPRPPKRTPKLHEKPSALKKSTSSNSKHENYLLLWVIFALLDSDPVFAVKMRIRTHQPI